MQTYNKGVKSNSYASNNKIQLNYKFVKNKYNQKFNTKFFKPF